MLLLFKLVSHIVLWLSVPFLLLASIVRPILRRGLTERLGTFGTRASGVVFPEGHCTLFCCASVGEVVTAAPFIRLWHDEFPEHRLVVATSSPTGREEARRRLGDIAMTLMRPVDLGFCPVSWLNGVMPTRVVLLETELWPLFLHECRLRRIPMVTINGRISDRSFPRYQKVSWLIRPMLAGIESFAVQNETYRERFIALGARPRAVHVTGNLKFAASRIEPQAGDELREVFGDFKDNSPLFLAGSTHQGEEKAVLEAFAAIRDEFPTLRLCLAPRHLERLAVVKEELARTGCRYVTRSGYESNGSRILLLDTHGELGAAYRFSEVAFVGGSLAKIGGHNLLEPAHFGVPVIHGPHTANFAEETALLQEHHGSVIVNSAEELAAALRTLLSDQDKREQTGDNARNAVDQVQGVLEATFEAVLP